MPIRIATLNKQIQKIGARLHQAIERRVHSQGVEHEPSAAERALSDERRRLKEAAAKRRADALLPKPKAPPPVKVAKAPKPPKPPKVKPAKETKAPKDGKAAKGAKPSRADKQAKKAQNLEAAKQAAKKSAKT